jgi:CHASE1-domain containing sensor protein/anti-sigma regulatory factor (Ser/Thr protein kinase)
VVSADAAPDRTVVVGNRDPAFDVSSPRWFGLRPTLWAVVVPAVIVILTMVYFFIARDERRQAADLRFEQRIAEIELAITARMDAYTEVLRGGLGLLNASTSVDRDQWRAYVETLAIETVLPGIQGIGYSEFVTPENKQAYEQRIRDEGFPDFRIRPEGERSIYSSITFLEPFDQRNRQAFGFDMYQQATRNEAMNRARDSGKVAISGRVTLVQEITDDVQAGFLMYLPYYGHPVVPEALDERQRRIVGFVYSPFRMGNLMKGILGVGLPDVRLEVFDGRTTSPEARMFDSTGGSTKDFVPNHVATRVLNVGQRDWTLRICSLRPFEVQDQRDTEPLIVASGIIVSFLIFVILRAFATTRERAQALADEMTVRLQQNARELERSNSELELFAYVASHDLKAPLRGIDHLANWIETDLGDELQGEPKKNMQLLRGRIMRLNKLLDDLLGYSGAGRIDAPIERVYTEHTVKEWFDALNTEERFSLQVKISAAEMVVRRVALEQVLTNLYANTMKHHDGDRGNIDVTVSEARNFYEILYQDDGPGIPADQRERAFQMFQTLKPRDSVEGSGMGMAIIKKIVEREGGSITCEDRPDGSRGVFFRILWGKADT